MYSLGREGDMRNRVPVIEKIKASEARQQWSELLNRVFRKEARMVVEKSGIPVAAVVSTEDLERLQQFDQQREHDLRVVSEIRSAFKSTSPEEIEQEAERALGQIRGKELSTGRLTA